MTYEIEAGLREQIWEKNKAIAALKAERDEAREKLKDVLSTLPRPLSWTNEAMRKIREAESFLERTANKGEKRQ